MRLEKMNATLRLAGLLLLPALLAACVKAAIPAPPLAAPSTLATLRIAPERAREEQAWDGVVEAIHQATLSAQTAGRVVELPYDVNDYVEAGAVVARFTDVEQGAGRNRAKATLASAKATYDEAEANYKRVAEVYARRLVSKAALDQALASRDAAKAAFDSAGEGVREASQQLDYTVIRAPFAGYVTKRHVEIGESVRAGQPLIAAVSLAELRVDVDVPQSAVDAIRRFDAADVLADAGARRIAATRITVFPYADPTTHTFHVRLDLPAEKGGLYPGMTVKAAFAIGDAARLLLPDTALIRRGEVSAAYVVADDRSLKLAQLRVGHRFGDRIEVLAGLEAGDEIAADPTAALDWLARSRDVRHE
ncbi:MAG TPA: efflux RND transporter periplasmic adaptor subunit [Rhodanobacteraceae bacterium]|nr:efflux RND transporter periplasmic adaptor subunit [Rhodanobacteraceae bacterium]